MRKIISDSMMLCGPAQRRVTATFLEVFYSSYITVIGQTFLSVTCNVVEFLPNRVVPVII